MRKKIVPDIVAKELKEALTRAAIPPQRELLERMEFGAAHSTLFPDSVAATPPMSEARLKAIEELRRSNPEGVAHAEALTAIERREDRARLARGREKTWAFIQRHDLLRPGPPEEIVVRAIKRDDDWRAYRGGTESAFALLRVAIDGLDPDPKARQQLATAIVSGVLARWSLESMDDSYRAVERARPEELLTWLLLSFGLEQAPGARQWNILMGLEKGPRGTDAAELGKLKRSDLRGPNATELAAATPILREVMGKVRDLRLAPWPRPADYKKTFAPLVARWNDEVISQGWDGIPLLCDRCWLPVVLRQPGFEKTNKGQVRRERSRTCSPTCAKRANRHP